MAEIRPFHGTYQIVFNVNGRGPAGQQEFVEVSVADTAPLRFFVKGLEQGFDFDVSIVVGDQPELIGAATKYISDEFSEFIEVMHGPPSFVKLLAF